MSSYGNLPPKNTNEPTTAYFNNFFQTGLTVSQNVDDAVLGFFQQYTGDKEAGELLASTVLYTATQLALDPMVILDELRKLKNNNKVEKKTPVDAINFISDYSSYNQIDVVKDQYSVGRIFYVPTNGVFYKIVERAPGIKSLETTLDFKAEAVILNNRVVKYNYFRVIYEQEGDDLNSYLTMFLNLNRVNTSLLGISNQPQTNKYIRRAILM